MAELDLLSRVPDWINRGLAEGVLALEAGGVVRFSSGANDGAVAAYVRQLTPDDSYASELEISGHLDALRAQPAKTRRERQDDGAVAAEKRIAASATAMQVAEGLGLLFPILRPKSAFAVDIVGGVLKMATFAYLRGRFDRLDCLVARALGAAQEALTVVEDVRDLQLVGFTRKVGRGIELTQRYLDGGDFTLVDRAKESFEEGLADIRTILQTVDGERMLENVSRVQRLLRLAALCAAGEIQALILADASLERRSAAMRAHQSFWRDILGRLNAVPGPATRIPTLAMLQTQRDGGLMRARRRWTDAAQSLLDIMEGELAFVETLRDMPPADLKRWRKRARDPGEAVLCLVRRGQDDARGTS